MKAVISCSDLITRPRLTPARRGMMQIEADTAKEGESLDSGGAREKEIEISAAVQLKEP